MNGYWIGRGKRIVALVLAALAVICPLASCMPAGVSAAPAADAGNPAAQVLQNAARALGWPAAVEPRPDLPGQAYAIRDSSGDSAPTRWAAISTMASLTEDSLLEQLAAEGLSRGLFHGRHAIIAHAGDSLSPDGRAATRGVIAWRYGPYVLSAHDDAGTGSETAIAEALWNVAQQALGAFPATVVILADTEDTPGVNSLRIYRSLTQSVDRFYALNAYGRVDLAYTFMDADGEAGENDWYTVGPSLASYEGRESSFAAVAVQAAFAGANLPEMAYGERIIVICPATASPFGDTRSLFAATYAKPPEFAIEVQGAEHKAQIHVDSLVVISEEDRVGTWVHEIGHTLYARHLTAGGHRRITDRYRERQGQVGPWDLMGTGSRWGAPEGSLPVHMSSFSKEAAGWLHFAPAAMDQTYSLVALENQKIGDAILTVDDPRSDDPRSFYIVEARDGQAFYGAPETGVLVYHVAPDSGSGGYRVDLLAPQAGEAMGQQSGVAYERPTLHGAAAGEGAPQWVDAAAGIKVTLVSESFAPYVATVRIERF